MSELEDYDGILIPGGFGQRGVEGMLEAIRWAREGGVPFFGICLGLQCAVIEFARNVAGMEYSHSFEFDQNSPHPVICLMDSQLQVTTKGGTMRLGAYPAQLCRRVPGGRESTGPARSASATATGTSSTTSTGPPSRSMEWPSAGSLRTGSWWR